MACERDSDGIWEDTELSVEAQGGVRGGGPKGPGRSRDGTDGAQSERSQGRDRLVSDTKRHGLQGHPVGGDESSGAMWEAKARPGVAHRLGLEERGRRNLNSWRREGGSHVTIAGEGGSQFLSLLRVRG